MNIKELAKQVGYPIQHDEWRKATEEFAALVAAHEREACAVQIKEMNKSGWDINTIVAAIRARSAND